jgi:hypothetical protein
MAIAAKNKKWVDPTAPLPPSPEPSEFDPCETPKAEVENKD